MICGLCELRAAKSHSLRTACDGVIPAFSSAASPRSLSERLMRVFICAISVDITSLHSMLLYIDYSDSTDVKQQNWTLRGEAMRCGGALDALRRRNG